MHLCAILQDINLMKCMTALAACMRAEGILSASHFVRTVINRDCPHKNHFCARDADPLHHRHSLFSRREFIMGGSLVSTTHDALH